jgi:ketosteroid isomerase-like protein
VSLFAAVGPSQAGWAVIEPTFRSVAARLSGGRDVTYELVAGEMNGDVARSAGIARFVVSMDGRPPEPMAVRLTTAFRRESGDWKIVHEHSDFRPPEHRVEESP